MNGMDWAILGVVLVLVVTGLWKGIIRLVFTVLSVAAAVVLACRSTGVGAELLTPVTKNPALAAVAAFVIVFVLVLIIMGMVGRLLSKAVHLLGLGWVDRLGGAIVGLAGAALIIGAVFLVIDLAALDQNRLIRESTLAPLGSRIAETLSGTLPEGVRDMIEKRRDRLEDIEDLLEKGKEKLEEIPSEVKERIPEDV
jgi:membrane protein required for colicin V production